MLHFTAVNNLASILLLIWLTFPALIARPNHDPIEWNSPELQQFSSGLDTEVQNDFEQFVMFMEKYNRSYNDLNEASSKFKVFRRNLADAMELQKRELGTARYGVTMFSDMEPKEFFRTHTGLKASESKDEGKSASRSDFKIEPLKVNGTLMVTHGKSNGDWRSCYCDVNKCCPIKNQGNCGSCYAFATVAVIESSHVQYSNELICLSEQEIVDCDRGCDGGSFPDATDAIRRMGGLAYEDDYPYHASKGQCHGPSGRKATIGPDIEVAGNEKAYYDALVYSPVYIGVDAGPLMHYQGGILRTGQQDWSIDHAVVLVGVGVENGQQYWIVRNSWSSNWGEQGYFRMIYGENELGLMKQGGYRI